jgi:hemerythrin superfamily protein
MERSEGTSPERGTSAQFGGADALSILKNDHDRVKQLFEEFDGADAPRRNAIARQICQELKVHAQIEEEILYPTARNAIDDADLVDEAVEEHAEAKQLIAQIEASGGDVREVEGRVQDLREAIEHHVEEEETELFPELRSAGLDLAKIGEQLTERKRELKSGGL